GASDPLHRLDHHSLLVDQRLLRIVVFRLLQQGRARYAWASAADRADRRGDIFHSLSAPLHIHSAADIGLARFPVRRPNQLRQAVQPSTVAAYRAAGDPVVPVCAPPAALGTARTRWLVRARRDIGAHHLSASFRRPADRGAAWTVLGLALAKR